MNFQWEVTPEQAIAALYDDYAKRIRLAIIRLARSFVPRIEAWLKSNAPWKDRTGNLRQSLFADVEAALTTVVIFFDYGLDYGKYVETVSQGSFAVIGPALDYWGPKFWAEVQALFK